MTLAAPAPAPPVHRLSEEAYPRMAWILRIGLFASLAVFLGAIADYLARHPHAVWSGTEANPSAAYLTVPGLFGGLAAGAPVAYLTLGILLLVATPLARVLSGLYYFERDGESSIAAVALTVFLMLLFGLFVVGPLIR